MTQNATTQHNAQKLANSMVPASTPADWNIERAKQYLSVFQKCKQPVVERTPATAQAYLEDQHDFKVKYTKEALDFYTEKEKSQIDFVPRDTSEFKSNQNLNSTLYRETPRNLLFSILTS